VEGDAVAVVAQERLAAGLGLEDAALAFLAEVLVEATLSRDQPDQAFGEMGVEVVRDQLPRGLGRFVFDHHLHEGDEVLFGAPGANLADDLAGGDIEAGDQALGAMADILVLAALDAPGAHRQPGRGALQGLDSGHLVERDGADAGLRALLGASIGFADIRAFLLERRVRLGGQP